ncbi:DUF771 domain-containing protein [Paenibacillus lutimineralis]|uniref:DUF771 domain-containing protein n=1 Tax=Paenibacillus lutimineralis TaxID=2707005 RepID=A0A3Q9IER2_9BACL|nr:DUF771 domain-containing protein [Paenibacillus lutimineralis]AZS17413.1 DUF771 domain-containing protein [Paenibacillus lutimineralis]
MSNESILQVIVDEQYLRQLAKEHIAKILSESQIGCWWDMKRLETETCRKRDWLISNILLNPIYREEMKVITNDCEDGRWKFKAKEMQLFLDKHFHELNRRKRGA